MKCRLLLAFLPVFLSGAPLFAQPVQRQLQFEAINPQSGLPEGWYVQPAAGVQVAADSVDVHEGRYALRVSSDGTQSFVPVTFLVTDHPDASQITLTGWIRAEGVEGSAGLWMRVDGEQGMLAFDNMQDRAVKGTTGWQQYSITLDYDKIKAKSMVLGALISGKGTIWVDDLRLTVNGRDLAEVPAYQPPLLRADKDTTHYAGSGIQAIPVNAATIRRLTNLGQLWGFLKYYHPLIQRGGWNMDAELFRVLPRVLRATDDAEANREMESWVDQFGPPDMTVKPVTPKSFKDPDAGNKVALKPDYGSLFKAGNFPESLIAKLKRVRNARFLTEGAHYYIALNTPVDNPAFTHEYSYPDLPYPDAGIRLLALYRYWNMIRYFFPYRHLIGEDWNAVLPEFIPEFCAAPDTTAYQVACLKLIARIHDTHANLWQGGTKLPEVKGRYILPFMAEFAEGKLVVTGYYKDTLGVKSLVQPGDVVEAIDGVPVDALVQRYLPLTPASNYATQLRELSSYRGFLLRGNSTGPASLTVVRDGNRREVQLARVGFEPDMFANEGGRNRSDRGFKMLPGNIGYLFPSKLTDGSIDSVKALLGSTKGLIVDLRCYPATFMPFAYGAWLKSKPSPFVRFTKGSIATPGLFVEIKGPSNGENNRNAYAGKVVIIVNEHTQSNAEYTTLALQTVPGAVTIGSTSAGADGNVSQIWLPGGIGTMISGINVLYPDGTETQRAGVKIDRVMRPTIRGIAAGRDELLEAAVKIIEAGK